MPLPLQYPPLFQCCMACALADAVDCAFDASGARGFFFSSRRRHTTSVSAFLLNRSSDLLLFLNPQCLASISRWITASSSWKRFCLFVCRALSSIMVICMLTAIRLLLTFVMSLYLLLRS